MPYLLTVQMIRCWVTAINTNCYLVFSLVQVITQILQFCHELVILIDELRVFLPLPGELFNHSVMVIVTGTSKRPAVQLPKMFTKYFLIIFE